MRIAYLTSADMLPGSPQARPDLYELEHQLAALGPACAARGLHLDLRVWDDPALRAEDYDAVVIGTTWDYQDRAALFLDRLDALGRVRPVLNPPAVVRWNAHKSYLADLERQGVPVVPTLWVDRVDAAALAGAYDALGADRLVAKPVVGACAVRQVRVARGEPLPPPELCPPAGALIQPFLEAAEAEGEYSFVFCGGELSHALLKRPRPGDYRVQSVYGGTEQAIDPAPADLALARAVLERVPGRLLYARVDMMRGASGQLQLMELELIEPYLYPEQGPGLGPRFAAALADFL